jgi:steroid delta-isomerase
MPNLCEQAVTEYFAAIRAGDVERPAPVPDPPGQSFQSVALTEEAVFVNGNSAAVKWTGKAISHSGKSVDFEGVDVLDCNDDGKITLVRAFWNPAPVMAIAQS